MGPATTIIEDGNRYDVSALPVVTVVIGILAAFSFAGGFRDFSLIYMESLCGGWDAQPWELRWLPTHTGQSPTTPAKCEMAV